MAGGDEDVARSLPDPPLAAPARREAAIGEALDRFDRVRAASVRPVPARAGPKRSWLHRPPLGGLVAASLVALIGLPVAWQIIREKTEAVTREDRRETADRKSFDIAEEAPPEAPAVAPKLRAVTPEPHPPAPSGDVASNPGEERAAEAAPPPSAAMAGSTEAPQALTTGEARRADRALAARSPTVLAEASREPAAVAAAPMLAAPPPPPPAMKAQAGLAAADASDSIVVTSARRRGKIIPDRGDWNACTVNDPRRSLAACRHLVDPAAKGTKGQAAAQLADGLSLAWQGAFDRAVAAFDRAVAIAPKSALAYLNRGLAYQRQGDLDRALADLDRAVQLAPGAPRGYYNRSLLLRERGDNRRANADRARAIQLDADYEAVAD